jgi:hypothetical protein
VAYDEKTAARVRGLLSARSDVVEKKVMGSLCFTLNGTIRSSVSGRGRLGILAPLRSGPI